jgi:nucleoside-diphosphate-sugar epimerase
MAARRGLVAVTGAGGFIGRRLVMALAARGWRSRVLLRRPMDGLWGEAAPQVLVGDLATPGALEALADGADALVHLAGLIKAKDRAAFFAVNADGAARAARAVLPGTRQGGARMILISSLAAREPHLSDYAASKRAGEEAARSVLGERLAVIRPPAVYGPGDRETLGLFRLAGVSPVLPYPDAPDARLALAYVDDVAGAVVRHLEAPWATGVFAHGGARPEGYAWREIFAAAAVAMDRAPRLAPVPGWLIAGAAAAGGMAARLSGRPAIFTSGKARELMHPDWSVADDELPPPPRAPCLDLPAGFARTVAWCREAGWLPAASSRP